MRVLIESFGYMVNSLRIAWERNYQICCQDPLAEMIHPFRVIVARNL